MHNEESNIVEEVITNMNRQGLNNLVLDLVNSQMETAGADSEPIFVR